ncbi:MAG: alkaline phytoceramidase, partial [Bacteroidia bacterium]|nr:alkaline phytoceramidase [Bacteroidia bacterium]
PLIIAGFISIVYWVLSGDLRLYGLVQFYPMIALPVIILFYKSKYNANGYWLLFIFYIIAKFLEYFDHEIFNILGFIGGHPLKHISAAIGVFFLLRYYKTRQAIIE